MEKVAYLFEDVFEASVFWNDDKTKLKMFVDNLEDGDLRAMISDASKRPRRTVPDNEKTCVPHDEVGYIELWTEKKDDRGEIYVPDRGYIPYELEKYIRFLIGRPMQPDEYAAVGETLRTYFMARGLNERN